VHQRLCALLGADSIELTKLFHAELVLAAAGPLQTQTK
jgi:hypothetical protein